MSTGLQRQAEIWIMRLPMMDRETAEERVAIKVANGITEGQALIQTMRESFRDDRQT